MNSKGRTRAGQPSSGRGAHIMALRNRARRPDTRPGRTGRATARRRAIADAS